MKLIITLILMLAILLNPVKQPKKYKILYMNSPEVWVNGKQAKVGDIFDDNATVKWAQERQAMKILGLDDNKRYLMACKPLGKKEQTVWEILIQNKSASTHASNLPIYSLFEKLERSIDPQYDLLDTIKIISPLPMNDKQYFIGTFDYGDMRLTKRLQSTDSLILIDKDIFVIDGVKYEPSDISLSIDYVDEEQGTTVFIKDEIELLIIPEEMP